MKAFLPLRHSIPLLILAAGVLIVCAAWVMEYRELKRNALRLGESQLRSIANFVAAETEAALRHRNPAGARAAVERAAVSPGIDGVFVVDPGGLVRYADDPRAVGEPFGSTGATTAIRAAMPDSDAAGSILIRSFEDHSRLVGRFPLHMRMSTDELLANRIGSLFVSVDLSQELARGEYRLALRMVSWIAILSLIALGLWLLLRWLLLGRIAMLIQTVREVGKGNFENAGRFEGKDELAELGREIEAMTQRLREHSERLAYLADHDALTGLLNRHGFEAELKRALRMLRRSGDRYALGLLDIDSLRVVNDTQGHLAGDELLSVVADLIDRTMPEAVCTARVGGDEFAVLLQLESGVSLESIAERLQSEAMSLRFESGGERFGVQVSLGLIELAADLRAASDALSIADAACYRAKEKGRGSYYIGSVDRFSSEHVRGDMKWVSRIQAAIDEDRLRLFAQPIVPVDRANDDGLHFEVLVRMLDEQGRILPPGEFLGAAERYNLVHRIDRWVLENTLERLADNPRLARAVSGCSINLSGQSLGDEQLIDAVSNWLERDHPVAPSVLCFEVTETAAIKNLVHARAFLDRLRSLGCRFALDDFGTGLSSFGYLKQLPVDMVKIDGMFVRDMVDDPVDRVMVTAINDIAHQIGLQTVAEFVENDETLHLLRRIGVDFAQGYAVGRPIPLDELLAGAVGSGRRQPPSSGR